MIKLGNAVLLAAALAGCGGGGSEESTDPYGAGTGPDSSGDETQGTAVHRTGDSTVSATIGAAGGTLALGSGARISVPAGALAQPVEITLAVGERTQAFNNNDYERPVGPTLMLQPAVVAQPGHPIEVSIPMASLPEGFTQDQVVLGIEVVDDEQRALAMGGVQTRWTHGVAAVESGRMVAELTELPGFRVQFLVSHE